MTTINGTWVSTETSDGIAVSCVLPPFDFPVVYDYSAAFTDPSNPAHFLEQYKEAINMNAIALAFMPQFSQLEQSSLDMLAYSYVTTASGVTLGAIGAIFGLSRGTWNDSEFRTAVRRKAANRGQPTPNDLLTLLKNFYGAEYVKYVSGVGGNIVMESDAVLVPEDVYSIIPAGVSISFSQFSTIVLSDEDGSFIVNESGDYIYLED